MNTKRATVRWLTVVLALWVLSGCDGKAANAETSSAPYSLRPPVTAVIGDLGGVPVSIPREYARLVEYEGDPHWLEKRTGPPPVRTFESKLTSFGILAHYPDMKPLTKESNESYRKTKFRDSEWIRMGVLAGSSLIFKSDPLERPYESLVPGRESHVSNIYKQLPMVYGLTPYKATKDLGVDLILDEEKRDHNGLNHILYFARDENGRITTFIRCSSGLTSAPGGTNSCQHHFVLLPEMKTQARLSYADGLLPNWRDYQMRYRDLILSFRVVRPAEPEPASKP